MRIKMLRSCSAGGVSFAEGETHDVPELTARKLIGLRRAVLAEVQSPPMRESRVEAPQVGPSREVKIDEVRKQRGRRR